MTLTDSNATTLRGGLYASSNFSQDQIIETEGQQRSLVRPAGLLKFDTHTTLPEGTKITSAKLTLTVAGGNAETRNSLRLQRELLIRRRRRHVEPAQSRDECGRRRGRHRRPLRYALDYQRRGSKVTFDVTALVPGRRPRRLQSELALHTRRADRRGRREPRFLQEDLFGRGAHPSLGRPSPSGTAGGPGARHQAPVPAPSRVASGTTLRVLQWNTHHGGYGTDGRYDTNRLATWICGCSRTSYS